MNAEKLRTIAQALHIIDEAAQESSDEVRQLISRDYRKLRQTLLSNGEDQASDLQNSWNRLKDRSVSSLKSVREQVADTSRQTFDKVDQRAHKSPWAFVGWAALTSIVVGFWAGRKSK